MKNSKSFTFRLPVNIRKRAEAINPEITITRFIHEAMLEKLAREENITPAIRKRMAMTPQQKVAQETAENFGAAVHMQVEQNIKEGKPIDTGLK